MNHLSNLVMGGSILTEICYHYHLGLIIDYEIT